jgi:putative sigma-54 modulation protein
MKNTIYASIPLPSGPAFTGGAARPKAGKHRPTRDAESPPGAFLPRAKGAINMKINITGKNIEVSEYLRELTEKKVNKLSRYFKPGTEVNVTLSVERSRHICEVTIPFDGGIVRGEEVTGDMYASIDNVLDKLEKQISRYRTKLSRSLRAGVELPVLEKEDEEPARKIVRTKRFAYKPMSIDEAVLQMDLLGHSFFVFTNAETDEVNVLYLRKDGNLGLIEPGYVEDDD